MPPKSIVCEFCAIVEGKNVEHRKDTIATHIRSKHVKELGKWLIQDSLECNSNTLTGFSCNRPYNPVYSKRYDGSIYIFGVSPRFFEDGNSKDDEELNKYIKCEDNIKAHTEFVKEVISNITLLDYIEYKQDIVVRSVEMDAKTKLINQLQNDNKRLVAELENKTNFCKVIEQENKDFREHYDTTDNIKKIIAENLCLNRCIEKHVQHIENLKHNMSGTERQQEELISEINMKNHRELDYYITQLDESKANCKKLADENEKIKTKIKIEAEKLFEKDKKEKKKAKKAKKKAKLMAQLNKSDSDSDSD
jgi:hypothetical protein